MKAGLTESQVLESRKKYGRNVIKQKGFSALSLFFRQITGNPLIIILSIATTVSFFLDEKVSAIYIFLMIVSSIVLGFWNEYSAEKTVQSLLKKISHYAFVIRDGKKREIPTSDVVIGDLVYVGPGNVLPADLTILEAENLELNESVLTGESLPVYKKKGECLMGTTVLNGWANGTVTNIGGKTRYGKIAQDVSFLKPETDFQKGLGKFGGLMVRVIAIMILVMLGLNVALGRDFLTASMFALAVAVGLTPELLPVVITISLSHGAGKLSKKHVIAKQLVSLENLGNMDVLCTDKTGTLTEGKIELAKLLAFSDKIADVEQLLEYALVCNSAIVEHKVMGNPLDVSIWKYALKQKFTPKTNWVKIFEQPFDYENSAAYTVAKVGKTATLITKGAPEQILSFCEKDHKKEKLDEFRKLSLDGYRVIAVATKQVEQKETYTWADVHNTKFEGFLTFIDTPKSDADNAIAKLKKLNVSVKILTGDNEIVTKKIAGDIGIRCQNVMIGSQLEKLSDEEIMALEDKVDIYARLTPEQKLRIIAILKRKGHTVGYLGDGVNDVPALHSADVGIAVDSGVDVAKDAANLIILKKDLMVIADGIEEGRKTFNNTLKYILMATSSNFGNMFSAAGASFFLPFLPMTPVQILLNNSLYDFSQMTLPTDSVDKESLQKPKKWNISFIKNYMLFFGPISSLYDFLTFGVMYFYFKANAAMFQTGWFVESLATQVLVVFVIRTSKSPFWKSTPGKWVAISALTIVATGVILPYSPLAGSLGFTPLPLNYFAFLVGAVTTYLGLVELAKRFFLRKYLL